MNRCITEERLEETGFSYTLPLINGKYKMTILYTLMEFKVVRFNDMKRYIGTISDKSSVPPFRSWWRTVWSTGRCTPRSIHVWNTRSQRRDSR